MINEEKNSQTHEQEEFLSENVPDNHQSENASGKCGLVSVVYHALWWEFDRETYEEKDFEEDEHEWYEADSELPARIEYLRDNADGCGYTLSDCRISLAEYTKPELTEQNISSIKTFFLLIRENENFYYSKNDVTGRMMFRTVGKPDRRFAVQIEPAPVEPANYDRILREKSYIKFFPACSSYWYSKCDRSVKVTPESNARQLQEQEARNIDIGIGQDYV